jgi:hypothetical protein
MPQLTLVFWLPGRGDVALGVKGSLSSSARVVRQSWLVNIDTVDRNIDLTDMNRHV